MVGSCHLPSSTHGLDSLVFSRNGSRNSGKGWSRELCFYVGIAVVSVCVLQNKIGSVRSDGIRCLNQTPGILHSEDQHFGKQTLQRLVLPIEL